MSDLLVYIDQILRLGATRKWGDVGVNESSIEAITSPQLVIPLSVFVYPLSPSNISFLDSGRS